MKRLNKLICLVLIFAFVASAGLINGAWFQNAFATADFELIAGSTLSIDTATATLNNLTPRTTVSTVVGNFKTSVKVYNDSDVLAADSAYVGTGYKIKSFSNGAVVATLTAVVVGDTTGDSIVSTPDFIKIKGHVKGVYTLTNEMYAAADATEDGKVSTSDIIVVSSALRGVKDLHAHLYGKEYVLSAATEKYGTADDAAAGTNTTGTANAGTYYVHKSYPAGCDGMYCLTESSSATGTGFWINPNSGSDDSSEATTGAAYEIVATINKYSSASDALNKVNSIGTVSAGTYYIYNKYPTGLNGMYCLSTDSTGATASFWMNPSENVSATATTFEITKAINKYATSTDALNKTNATGTVPAGTYYIYNSYPNGYNGMYNITVDSTGATAGFWINPAEMKEASAATYVLTQDMPKYSNSADALNKTNSSGTAAAGTYYIYNKYPTGLNGMYNLTSDSTGKLAGFWINPSDSNISTDGTITLVRPINKYASSADAVNQANITGTASEGTYYIYNNYPNGLNGMYNITTDSTGSTAGFWVNPIENTEGQLNYATTKAIWLSQFDLAKVYVSGSSQNSQSAFRYRIKQAMTAIKSSGYNTIMVQVRPNGDAFYTSQYFPWSKYVVGSYGATASYDPFDIIIEEARAKAISVHAWVNPMRLMSTSEITSVSSNYVIRQWYNDTTKRGKYIVAVDGTYYLNPGYSDVRELIVNGVTEICQNYSIDGIHFDDYFYPEGTTNSFDQEAFTASGQTNRATWRRLVVNAFVRSTYSAIKAIDSDIVFGISPAGSITNNQNYLYADVRTWCSTSGYVDYIAPQIYWGFEHQYSPFDDVLAEWEAIVTNADIKLIPAVSIAKAGGDVVAADGSEWTDNKDVIKRQFQLANTCKNFGGVMVFSLADYFNPANGSYVSALEEERNNYEPVLKAMYGG